MTKLTTMALAFSFAVGCNSAGSGGSNYPPNQQQQLPACSSFQCPEGTVEACPGPDGSFRPLEQGFSPVCSDGILVCPTNADAHPSCLADDQADNALLFSYDGQSC